MPRGMTIPLVLFFSTTVVTDNIQELQAKTPTARQQRLQHVADAVEHLPYKDDREGLDHVALFGASAWQLPGLGGVGFRWRL